MTEQYEQRIMEAVKRADSFSNAITALVDSKRAGYPPEPGPDYWPSIHAHVIPTLEREMHAATEEVTRLKRA